MSKHLVRTFLALALTLSGDAAFAQGHPFKAEFMGFTNGRPVALKSPPGETHRLFIVDKTGRIRIVKNGVVLGAAFLNWTANIDANGEGGLLGMAFHPDYPTNGRFYISYTAAMPGGPSVVSELRVQAGNPDLADAASETIIWGPQPQSIQSHKGGDLHFGPDGLLYFSIGDGSDGGTLMKTAQDLSDPRGKILRFDVDLPWPHIPPSNPFAGMPALAEEVFAYGLRNPFRFGIDSLTGDLYVGDVGATSWEEINFIPAGMGGLNFGWPCKEGTNTTSFTQLCLPNPRPALYQFNHNEGCAVIGGTVYRGALIPQLQGKYVFADFCSQRFWYMNPDGTNLTEISAEFESNFVGGQNKSPVAVCADSAGELYILNHYSSGLWRVVPDCPAPTKLCTPAPNSAGPGAQISSTGSQSEALNDFALQVASAPPLKLGRFFYGPGPQAALPVGDGIMCMLPPFAVLGYANTNASGMTTFQVDMTLNHPFVPIDPGTTYYFQYAFRDPGFGPKGFNFSDALLVSFCP